MSFGWVDRNSMVNNTKDNIVVRGNTPDRALGGEIAKENDNYSTML